MQKYYILIFIHKNSQGTNKKKKSKQQTTTTLTASKRNSWQSHLNDDIDATEVKSVATQHSAQITICNHDMRGLRASATQTTNKLLHISLVHI